MPRAARRGLEVKVRLPAMSGAFYPAGPGELRSFIRGFIDKPSVPTPGLPQALLVPHAGYAYSGRTAGEAFALLGGPARELYKRVVLIGPSHTQYFTGIALDTSDCWRTPLGDVAVDPAVHRLDAPLFVDLPEAHRREHCIEVELPFLQETLSGFSILPLITGEAEAEEAAQSLLGLIDEQTLLVISTDLSHYLEDSLARQIDRASYEAIIALDSVRFARHCQACGKTAALVLMHIARELGWEGRFISYANSGDVSGDRRQVVGYAGCAFYARN
jgi:MEMO1 family protein